MSLLNPGLGAHMVKGYGQQGNCSMDMYGGCQQPAGPSFPKLFQPSPVSCLSAMPQNMKTAWLMSKAQAMPHMKALQTKAQPVAPQYAGIL